LDETTRIEVGSTRELWQALQGEESFSHYRLRNHQEGKPLMVEKLRIRQTRQIVPSKEKFW
jgi:hypothetical protein